MGVQSTIEEMTKELITRKQAWDHVERTKRYYVWSVLGVCGMLVFLLSQTVDAKSLPHEELLASPVRILLLLVLVICMLRMIALTKKATKKEKEFESLRYEFIDRDGDLWIKSRSFQEKEAFLKEMNDQYGINLYYFH
ncbi:DUF2663 family protein [Shouchella patagoniensis]|uniref:DUF2663 family protein n=1 Tax=Shouchella patagoniensis TaxID=228576 RepID=UPI001475A137|nr:DUF2663 family protein [Shouchella patagoniensis]